MMSNAHFPERRESLWVLTVSPVIWSVHALLSYITAAVWCAKAAQPGSALSSVRIAIALYTVVALIGIGLTGWRGFRKHLLATATSAHDFDSPAGRHDFLGFAVVLLSMFSALATVYVALPIVFIETCR